MSTVTVVFGCDRIVGILPKVDPQDFVSVGSVPKIMNAPQMLVFDTLSTPRVGNGVTDREQLAAVLTNGMDWNIFFFTGDAMTIKSPVALPYPCTAHGIAINALSNALDCCTSEVMEKPTVIYINVGTHYVEHGFPSGYRFVKERLREMGVLLAPKMPSADALKTMGVRAAVDGAAVSTTLVTEPVPTKAKELTPHEELVEWHYFETEARTRREKLGKRYRDMCVKKNEEIKAKNPKETLLSVDSEGGYVTFFEKLAREDGDFVMRMAPERFEILKDMGLSSEHVMDVKDLNLNTCLKESSKDATLRIVRLPWSKRVKFVHVDQQ